MSHFLLLTAQSNFLLKSNSPLVMELQVLHCMHEIQSLFFILVAPSDYIELNVTLMFEPCKIRRCVNVTIMDDFIDEQDENFFYKLLRTPDLHPRITLDPVDGEIVIVDDDG